MPLFDNTQAETEGWAVLIIGSEYQLQSLDGSDCDAWDFVVKRSNQGSEYHSQVLKTLAEESPAEFKLIDDRASRLKLDIRRRMKK